ncbi:hypothetical protein BWQ96_10116 [Gracilariopsis chorda]|uniref:DUF99 family protein n=1 Tax=Gracilariopsis chorda TaxID=448386 RepID=A0A2V3IDS3_9FLOR|nr:hypothetical protein BWQ96_10116 [Gracilariopsis chorda]|eukprot:PXF40178.1 hypothetical protein BWQ96_10116 [Gracilariopsis chorda]
MKSLSEIVRRNLSPRILGFDDAPFQSRPRVPGSEVHAVGVVTSLDRFEGMLYCGEILQDGLNAGERLADAVCKSKFHDQIHAIFLDGVTMGGLNVIDIQNLADALQRPVIAVMRSQPNIEKMLNAIGKLPLAEERRMKLSAAGPIHQIGNWIFQYRCPRDGEVENPTAQDVATLLDRCTPEGTQKIPECLRIAHLIGAAIKCGQSSSAA